MVKIVRKPWYIIQKGIQRGGEEEKKAEERNNSKLLITLLGHDRGCFSALLYVPL